MEDHRVHIRLPARDRRYALELIEPLLVKEDGLRRLDGTMANASIRPEA